MKKNKTSQTEINPSTNKIQLCICNLQEVLKSKIIRLQKLFKPLKRFPSCKVSTRTLEVPPSVQLTSPWSVSASMWQGNPHTITVRQFRVAGYQLLT